MKSKGEKKGYTQLNVEFHRIARGEKKAFFNEQCNEIEGKNRKGKTRDLFNQIGNIKRTCKDGPVKVRNGKNIIEAEEIKKDHKNTENYTKRA